MALNTDPASLVLLIGVLAALFGGDFAAALARLKSGGATGRSVIVLWLARLGIALRDREDTAQQVLLRAFRSWRTFDPSREQQVESASGEERAAFSSWLRRITADVAAHHRQLAHVRREELLATPRDEADPDPAASPEELVAAEEDRLELLDHIRTLAKVAPDEAAVIMAHEIDSIPLTEIAILRGVSTPTVRRWRARGLAALHASFAPPPRRR